jgi:tetratricopeptide (TPR) repeat protein
MAKLEYEKALDKLGKADSQAADLRAGLTEKLGRAVEALANEHRRTGEELLEQEYFDDARELFQLAADLSRDPELLTVLETRLKEIDRRTGESPPEGASGARDPAPGTPEDSPESGEEETFTALCGTLPEEAREAYLSYGPAFTAGYLALNRGDFDLAVRELSEAHEKHPSPDSFIPLELATALLNLGQPDEARPLLEEFLRHHPDALPGYQVLCEVFWEKKDFEGAEALLAQCPDELKHSLAYHLLRGETLFQSGDYSRAVAFYQTFMEEEGWHEPVARALASAFEALDDLENARRLYGEIMDQCRSCHTRVDPWVKRRYADISFDTGRVSTAVLEIYLSLIQEDPENAPLYYQRLSRIYGLQGNEEESRRFEEFARQAGDEKD